MFFKTMKAAALALGMIGISAAPSNAKETVPLDAFAMMPTVLDVAVSPNGKNIGIIRATNKEGDYILEVRKTANLEAKPVRIGSDVMEIRSFNWLTDKRILVNFRQNVEGANSNSWVNRSAIINADASGKWLQLPEGATILSLWAKNKNEILIEHDANDNRIPDVMRFNIRNGRTSITHRGNDRMGGYVTDLDGEVRAASGFDVGSGSIKQYARLKGDSDWKLVKTISPDLRETFDFLGFSVENPNEVYVVNNGGQDKAGIYTLDIASGQLSERMFGLKSVDASGILRSRKPENLGQLTGFTYRTSKLRRYFLDPAEKALQEAVEGLFPGKSVSLYSRSEDDNAIVIYTSSDKDPGSYYLLRDKSKLDFLATELPLLKEEHLSTVKYIKYTARDGMKIPAFVTIPNGEGPFPAVVLPHGGPWARDAGGFDEWAQLLAHHGYVVIQPQFRGSEGFGLAHWKAGDEQWGLAMQDDNDDAAQYLIDAGLATADKLAIFGWSYGGYAAFAGSMRDNNIYQCSIAGAGVSDLSLIRGGLAENPYLRRLQRPTIKGVSPIEHVDKVNVPILVIHGDIDERVDVVHSRKFVDKLKDFNKDHKYIELKGADHFSSRLYYHHKTEFYGGLLDFLGSSKCFGK